MFSLNGTCVNSWLVLIGPEEAADVYLEPESAARGRGKETDGLRR